MRSAAACQEADIGWEVLQILLEQVQDDSWVPKWDTFSSLMSACRRNKDPNQLLQLFKSCLPYKGFTKTVLLNILLAGLCEAGNIDLAAFYLLHTAEAKWAIQPNDVRYAVNLSSL